MELDLDGLHRYADALMECAHAKRIPRYHVYLLLLRDQSKIKIGYSGDWVNRAYRFLGNQNDLSTLWDLEHSVAFPVPSKREALTLERQTLQRFKGQHTLSPYDEAYKRLKEGRPFNDLILIPWGSGGHKEWLKGDAYAKILNSLSQHQPNPITLKRAIEQEKILFKW